MKKKNQFITYSLLTAMLLTAVPASHSVQASSANTVTPKTLVTKSYVTAKEDIKIENVKIKKYTKSKTYKTDKGKTAMTVKYHRPILQGNFNSIKKINQFYEKQEKNWFKYISPYAKDAKAMKEDEYSNTYDDNFIYEVTYNQKGYISILSSGYLYTGGAHGSPYCEAHTFDLNTGKELKLTDIMKGTDKTLNKKISAAFENKIKKDPDMFFSDALKTVKNSAGKTSPFYLTKNKICFYYDVYALAPYAAGTINAYIPYATKDTFKINL